MRENKLKKLIALNKIARDRFGKAYDELNIYQKEVVNDDYDYEFLNKDNQVRGYYGNSKPIN